MSGAFTGGSADNDAYDPFISPNGKMIAFRGPATNIVAGDTNGVEDVFFRRTKKNATIARLSVNNFGVETDGYSTTRGLSTSGRYVLITSFGTALVQNDTNASYDAFVADTQEHLIQRVSLGSDGNQLDGHNYAFDISDNGRFVLFSSADDDATSDDGNGFRDVMIRDLQLGTTELISKTRPGLSTDDCYTSNQVIGKQASARYVLFICEQVDGSTFGESIFRLDRKTNQAVLVSVDSNGNQGTHPNDPAMISENGRYVVFTSQDQLVPEDTNSVNNVYIRDLKKSTTKLAVLGNGGTLPNAGVYSASMTPDARYIMVETRASNMDSLGNSGGVSQCYRYDRKKRIALRISQSNSGESGNGDSSTCQISANGKTVVYESSANNLVDDDDNATFDVFLRTLP